MEKCPVELLVTIARFACTDGGYTGCSLSLVSHYFRDATKPARYHSVALTSSDRIRRFRMVLQTAETTPVIRHLLISLSLNPDGGDLMRGGGHRDWETPDCEGPSESVIEKTIHTILRAAAPTLITLFLDDTIGLRDTIPDHYPHLRDLCVSSIFDSPTYTDAIAPDNCPFPSLSRLLITSGCHYMVRLGHWRNLARVAPNVVHIRLMDAEYWLARGDVDRLFHAFLNVPWKYPINQRNSALDPVSIAALLGRWRSLHINPDVLRGSRSSFTDRLHWDELCRLAIDAEERGGDRALVVGARCDYGSRQMRADWQDVVDGGEGPWAVPAGEA